MSTIMGVASLIRRNLVGRHFASAMASPRLRQLSDHGNRYAASLAAGLGTVIFLVDFAKWMIRWRGVPTWHIYADQGWYLKSARAFASFDFNPASHHYPPLYPALAAPFTSLIPNDPFVIINAASLAASAAMLVDAFGAVIGSRAIAGLFTVVFLLLPNVTSETFVIPWTSTAATFLVIAGLFLLRRADQCGEVTPWRSFLFGLALGLLVPTRPLDAVVALALVPFWMFCVLRHIGLRHTGLRHTGARHGTGLFAAHLVFVGIGAAIGPAILLATNHAIYGALLSPYMASSAGMFAWDSLGAKFVSIFFDSAGLFVEPTQTLMSRFPWLTLAMGGMVACLLYGPAWLRAASVFVALQFACYLCYLDLLPNGLYRYLNYHYFRCTLWLAFLMLPAGGAVLWRHVGRARWQSIAVLVAAAIGLACLQFQTTTMVAAVDRQDGRIDIDLPRGGRIDYVDVIGLTADWDHTYGSDPRALLDGHPFQGMDKIRGLPTATGTRFLFLHPIDGGRLEIPDTTWTLNSPRTAEYGRYAFALGFPKWLGRQQDPVRRGVPLRLDSPMGDYVFARGFAPFDGHGRAIEAGTATLRLGLVPGSGSYRVRLGVVAGVPTKLEFRLANSTDPALTIDVDGQERNVELMIPPASISTWGWPSAVSVTVHGAPELREAGDWPKITAITVE